MYGGCVLSPHGLLHDTITVLFFSQLTKIKTMLKLLWPALILNSIILGSNKSPGDNPQTLSDLTEAANPYHVRQIIPFETQNVSYFSFFTIRYGDWNHKSLFLNIQCCLQ